VAAAAFGRQPDSIARTARQVDSHDAVRLDERSVPPRHRGAEDGQHGRANRRREVHRAGVAGHHEFGHGQDSGQHDQIDTAFETYRRDATGPQRLLCLVYERTITGRASEYHRRVHVLRQGGGDLGESCRWPLFDRAAASHVNRQQRRRQSAASHLCQRRTSGCSSGLGNVESPAPEALRRSLAR
jgi:hypothetical protein